MGTFASLFGGFPPCPRADRPYNQAGVLLTLIRSRMPLYDQKMDGG